MLTKEIDWSALPADAQPHVRRLLRRCLAKDARRRLRGIGDARIELEEPATSHADAAVTATRPQRSISRRALLWIGSAAAGAAVTALIAWTVVRQASPSSDGRRWRSCLRSTTCETRRASSTSVAAY
ncbi:MAG: hypothetical protein ACT4QD_00485 [Acidobacteriota bacterium]